MPTQAINLNLGQVPVNIDDPVLYSALLDIHTALEILAGRGSTESIAFDDFIARFLKVTLVSGNYNVLDTDGLILAAATTIAITISLPNPADVSGYEFTIKCIDDTFAVTILGSGGETIDGEVGGIGLTLHDSVTVKSDGVKWHII